MVCFHPKLGTKWQTESFKLILKNVMCEKSSTIKDKYIIWSVVQAEFSLKVNRVIGSLDENVGIIRQGCMERKDQ